MIMLAVRTNKEKQWQKQTGKQTKLKHAKLFIYLQASVLSFGNRAPSSRLIFVFHACSEYEILLHSHWEFMSTATTS